MTTITYTESAEPLVQLRIHIKTCTVLDLARYRRNLREVNEWVVENLGKPIAELTDAELDAAEEDGTLPMFRVGQDRAEMLAALGGVERREGDGEWLSAQLPDAWQDIEGFAQQMPAGVYLAWRAAMWACNPGLFGTSNDDDEKKSGHISVS